MSILITFVVAFADVAFVTPGVVVVVVVIVVAAVVVVVAVVAVVVVCGLQRGS